MAEYYTVDSGVTSAGLILSNNDYLFVSSGGTAIGTVFGSGSEYAEIENGGLLISNTVSSGAIVDLVGNASASVISAGGTLNARGGCDYDTYGGLSALIDSTSVYGNFAVQGGYESDAFATANHTDVYSGGKMTVQSGCSALNTNVYLGGSMFVDFEGTASNTVADGGIMRIEGGASAVGITAKNKGIVKLIGDASDITVSSGGAVFVLGGAEAENITVTGGGVFVATGGEIKGSISIAKTGGLYLYGGSIVNGEIHVKGTLYVDETMVNNGEITVSLNSASPVTASIQNLDYMTGTTNIMVDTADSTEGSYLLADNAAAYNGTVTLTNNGKELGTLSIGETATIGGTEYSLTKSEATLIVGAVVVEEVYYTCAGNFTGKGGAFQLMEDGTACIRTSTAKTELSGTVDTSKWLIAGAGDFNGSGKDGLLWVEKATGYVYMQYDMTSLAEINNRSNLLGIVGEGYSIVAAGDFTGNSIAGALLQGPAFGDPEFSLNYGLPVWAREDDGSTFNGWLGALVNTWQEGDPLKGDLTDPASINANNYQYAVIGVGDFNGDGVDDVMLQNTMPKVVTEKGVDYTITGSGDVFTFLTGNKDAIKRGDAPTVCYAGCATDGWKVIGFGDFDKDGIDDTLLSDGTGLAGWKMANGQRQDNFWFGNMDVNEEFAGIADFNNDGTDDILVRNIATEDLNVWLVKDGAVTGSIALK